MLKEFKDYIDELKQSCISYNFYLTTRSQSGQEIYHDLIEAILKFLEVSGYSVEVLQSDGKYTAIKYDEMEINF